MFDEVIAKTKRTTFLDHPVDVASTAAAVASSQILA